MHGRKIIGPERVGEQLGHGPRPPGRVDEQVGSAVLDEELAAAPAGHQNGAAGVADGDRSQPSATTGNEVTDEYTFGTKSYPM